VCKIVVIGNNLLSAQIPQFISRRSPERPTSTIPSRFQHNTSAIEFLHQFLHDEAIVQNVGLVFDRAFAGNVEKDRAAGFVVRCLNEVTVLERAIFVRVVAGTGREVIDLA
jgi:hypothetical protein